MTFLLDLGVEMNDGELRFVVEAKNQGGIDLQRVTAHFQFKRPRLVEIDREKCQFDAGEQIRLFFSYRLTPSLVRSLFASHKMAVESEWVTKSGDEGVFAVCRAELR